MSHSDRRDRLLGFRVSAQWLARWHRELARIKADTGIHPRALSLIVLDVLRDSVPAIRARAISESDVSSPP
ncbi:MAG TPA: hypothetical protein VHX38_02830 [Pseudonocardiaceae bacterium]|nr:hypothetical protein [Pseudonocardiaceae bacterium]